MVNLFSYTNSDISLQGALNALASKLDNATAFLYTPKDLIIAKFENSKFACKNGEVSLDKVFEARVFNQYIELRWVAPNRAAVITEEEIDGLEWKKASKSQNEIIQTQDNSYLLWGEGIDKFENGWGGVSSAQIGTIYLPMEVGTKKRVLLKTKEYFSNKFVQGNYAVIDERLVGLEVR
ncbi:MAG: CRISPR-associated protein Csx19 [Armatimonadota bacterium]